MKHPFFQNKTVLVTGGSSGIGLAIAKELVLQGASVTILARRIEQLEAARQELLDIRISDQQSITTLAADVSDPEQLKRAIGSIPSPDILINSAGVAMPGFVHQMPIEQYRWMMDINFFGTVNTTHCILPGMLKRGSGVIVNICSFLGVVSIHGYSSYSATKYAVRGFTDSLRAEVHSQGIQVAIAFPDDTDTPQFAEEFKHRPEIVKAIWGESPPMPANKVAKSILNGIARRHYMIVPGVKTNILFDLVFLIGRHIHRVINLLESIGRRSLRSPKK